MEQKATSYCIACGGEELAKQEGLELLKCPSCGAYQKPKDSSEKVKIGKIVGGPFKKVFVASGEGVFNGEVKRFSFSISETNKNPVVSFGNQNYILSWLDIEQLAIDAGLFKKEVTK